MNTLIHDRYEILSSLGKGGQAETLLAHDTHTGLEVALKCLHMHHVEDWKAVELFEREGRVLQSIDHACVPDYIDAFTVQDGQQMRLYLAQEYVHGEDYRHHLARHGTLDEEQVESLLVSLLETLDVLHRRVPPIVHRDIKPSNIIASPEGRSYLIDFGAAQHTIARTLGESTMVGTPGYMPMEQVVGRAGPASDLYSLAVTLCELWTGVEPTRVQLREGKLDYLSLLPEGSRLAQLLDHMLEPLVEKRPASAQEVLEAWRSPSPLVDFWSPGAREPRDALPHIEVAPTSQKALDKWLSQIESGPRGSDDLLYYKNPDVGALTNIWKRDVPRFEHDDWQEVGAVLIRDQTTRRQFWEPYLHEAVAVYRHRQGHAWLVVQENGGAQMISFLSDGRAAVTNRPWDVKACEESGERVEHFTSTGIAPTSFDARQLVHPVEEGASFETMARAHARHLSSIDPAYAVLKDVPLEWMMMWHGVVTGTWLQSFPLPEQRREARNGLFLGVGALILIFLFIPIFIAMFLHTRQDRKRVELLSKLESWRHLPGFHEQGYRLLERAARGALSSEELGEVSSQQVETSSGVILGVEGKEASDAAMHVGQEVSAKPR